MSSAEPNFIMMHDVEPSPSVERLRRQALRLLHQGGDDANYDPEDGRRAASHEDRVDAPDERSSVPMPARSMMVGLVTMPAVFFVVVIGALTLFGAPAAVKPIEPAIVAAQSETLAQPVAARVATPVFASALTGQPLSISLGDDEEIRSIALDGDRVALHVEGPQGQQLVIYDYLQGRIVAQAPIEMTALEAIDSLSAITGPPPVESKPAAARVAPAAESQTTETLAMAPVDYVAAAPPQAPTLKPRSAN